MNRLIGIQAKFERTDEHVREIESHILRFFESSPYEPFSYHDDQTGDHVWAVHVHADPPLIIGVIASEIFHHLRSILDHMVWQLVEANGHDPSKQRCSFPISDSVEEFQSGGLRQVRRVADAAVDLVKAAKPYKGGNDGLWRLHELSRIDKHRVPIPVGSAYRSVGMDVGFLLRERIRQERGHEIPEMRVSLRPADRSFPLREGAEVYRVLAGNDLSQVDMNPQFTFEVAFGEGEVLEGEPIIPALHQFVSLVKATVEPFRPLLG